MDDAEKRAFIDRLPRVTCDFCGGGGTMREVKRYTSRMIDEDEDTEHATFVGEVCPMCRGEGEVRTVGGACRLSS